LGVAKKSFFGAEMEVAAPANTGLVVQGSYDNNANPKFSFQKSNGTYASRTAITSGHVTGQIKFSGYDGDSWHTNADIYVVTSGTIADGRVAGDMVFRVAPDSAAGAAEAFRLASDKTATFSGVVSVDDTTDSSSTTTGSIHTAGGLGVAEKSFFGGAIDVTHTDDGSTNLNNMASFKTTDSNGPRLRLRAVDGEINFLTTWATSGVDMDMSFSTTNAAGASTEAMRIDATNSNATFAGDISIDGTTDSSSTTTGSIHTDGGLGVAKETWLGDLLTIEGGATSGNGIHVKGTSSPRVRIEETANTVYMDMVVDTTSGYIGTGSNDGLVIRTNNVAAITIDTSQNGTYAGVISVDDTTDSSSPTTGSIHTAGGLGVAKNLVIGANSSFGSGTIISDLSATFSFLQVGGSGFLANQPTSGASKSFFVSQNAHINAAGNWEYVATDQACMIEIQGGGFDFYTAPSGTAGNNVTMTQQFAVKQDGGIFANNLISTTGTNLLIDGNDEIAKDSSSQVYKENIRPSEMDTSQIFNNIPKDFNFIADKDKYEMIGWIAEEVAEVCPNLARFNSEGKPESWDLREALVMTVAELDKSNARIESLEAEIEQLK
jgi:hypothetical protein